MKKNIYAFVVFLGITATSQAQFSVGFSVGASIPTAGTTLPGFVNVDKNFTQKSIVTTLGAGMNYNISAGYKINKYITANLDVSYLDGFKGGYAQYVSPNTEVSTKFKVSFLGINPSIVITADNDKTFSPFVRFGLVVGGAKIKANTTVTNTPGQDVSTYSGGIAVGFLGGLGGAWKLNDKTSFIAELAVRNISVKPKQISNQENFGAPTNETEYFKKTITPTSPDNERLEFSFPFNSAGINVGITYHLGK